ncbi:hypothetical protein [Streptomyces sp. NPDC088258]|uniref:phage tail protein n=1 Tax=Streptomyces sp. NPDC088258 TaxID=3365849 RepID=UPI00381CEA45
MKAAAEKTTGTARSSAPGAGSRTASVQTAPVSQTSQATEPARAAVPARAAAAPGTIAAPSAARGLSARSVQRLQSRAGNAAVSRLVAQRYADVVKPPPSQAPGFRKVQQDVAAKKQTLKQHKPAAAESRAAQNAAVAPPDDKEAQGKTANAEKMNDAKPGEFNKAEFVGAVNEAIAAQAPKNLDEADKFAGSGKAENVKNAVDGKVKDGKESSAEAIETATTAPPDTSKATDKEVTPLNPDQPPANPGAPSAAAAVPATQPDAVLDFREGNQQVDQHMADAEVTEDQLARGNEPAFDKALSEKKKGEQDTAEAPGKGRAAEAEQLAAAKAGAAASGARAMAAMTADRNVAGKSVDSGKGETKSADEKKREQVTAKLQKVFDTTQKDVEKILKDLDGKVDRQFTEGEKRARDNFTADHKRRMKAYKDKRYSGLMGKGRWVKDKFKGLPQEGLDIFKKSRELYVDQMQTVISAVADMIGTELGRAKARIATGRNELKAEVDRLPADLKKFGEEAAADFAGKFDDLESEVNDKSTQLVQDLAQKYTEALNSVDEEIKKLEEENKGIIAAVMDAVVGVIQTILELKNMLMGVLAKAASAIGKIIKDPIGFLKNLVSALGAGLNLFIANVPDHLQKGLVSWLLGTAVSTGLAIPAKFDLKGVIQLIASLLGLTWDNIRARVTRKGVPDKAMAQVEQSVPVAGALAREGPAGAVNEIKEETGDLKKEILDDLKSYLIPTVLIAGITWILSLLTPASAFVRAVKGIIDLVTFIVTQGAQIFEFVNACLDAVIAVANGGSAGVPKTIETALAASIPLLLGLLASLLGIGGLANRVRQAFQKVSNPVNRAIDKIVNKIAKKGKTLWSRLKAKSSKGMNKRKDGKNHRDKKRDEAEDSPHELRRAARKAAERGWNAAAQRSKTEAVLKSDLESAVLSAEGSRDGVRITLHIAESGTSWQVEARAAQSGRRATALEGDGWIAQGKHNEHRYAAQNLSSFNRALVNSAFDELKDDTGDGDVAADLRANYEHKIKASRRIERTHQERLEGRIKGLLFAVSTEPFSGAENDKKIRTEMSVSPNETAKTDEVPLSGEVFPYKIGKATAPVGISKARQPIEKLSSLRLPFLSEGDKAKMKGYVVNMAAQPGEVQPGIAARYVDEAWVGSSAPDLATASTAVVIGVNTFKRLDPQSNKEGLNTVRTAMANISQPRRLRMAVMGFTWTPTWMHVSKGPVPLEEVRAAYSKLRGEEKQQAIAANEGNWREGGKLPYGIFREGVLGSSYTAKAVDVLSAVNQQVHSLSQDADGGVRTPSGRGVLEEYNRVLRAMASDPILTVGGYTFDGFDWGAMANSRTAQLTTLSNVVDRAIRKAIAKVHVRMLYPAEPNSLIKLWDGETGDGIFQNSEIRAGLNTSQGSLYGIGSAEGRKARDRMANVYGREKFSMAYTPDARTVTSPLPEELSRGLTITPEDVHELAAGERFGDSDPEDYERRKHRAYALIMQSQTTASAKNLALEFRRENPKRVRSADQERLQNSIFVHVEEMVKMMTDNPSLTADSSEVKAREAALKADAEDLARDAKMAGREKPQEAIVLARRITEEIIQALSAEDLGDTWNKLHTLLNRIMKDPRPSQGGPR